MNLDDLTWTCHVCKQRRPDRLISVHKHEHPIEGHDGAYAHCSVRYCNDDPECFLGAQSICFVSSSEDAS